MDSYKLLITGGIPLTGETYVSGGKNTSVAVIPATLLSDDPCTIENLPDIDGLYIGGGYPELFSKELSSNSQMLKDIK